FLYGRNPFPFQTLNFLRGSQQRVHSDTIHFNSKPARFMCGAWAALEDITPENGPLFYYPGSHKLPEYTYHDIGLPQQKGPSNQVRDYPKYEDFLERLVTVQGLRKETIQ